MSASSPYVVSDGEDDVFHAFDNELELVDYSKSLFSYT
jgi:hypothetical protein